MSLDTLRSEIARAEFESVKGKPDLFEIEDPSTFGFPCLLCAHADTDLEIGPCRGCSHYAN